MMLAVAITTVPEIHVLMGVDLIRATLTKNTKRLPHLVGNSVKPLT